MNARQPQAHKHHNGILIVLVICCLSLFITIFGLIAIDLFETETEVPSETVTEVTSDEDDVEDDESVIEISIFDRFGSLPDFEYPSSWHMVINDYFFEGDKTQILDMSPQPMWFCEGCDGPYTPITITSQDSDAIISNHESFLAFVEARYADEMFYTDVVVVELSNEHGDLYQVSGSFDALGSGTFDELVFDNGDQLIIVNLMLLSGLEESSESAAWDIVSSSIDFSNIN
ncbi:hypothetical protein HON52_03660 [Candidatus Uhrbacteria bacterium]|jgi:hypothetical protein|nr:hypothetical protein [Candidatus Uhrbacteria bacterium]